MDIRTHWEQVYASKAQDAVSWYRPHLETSIALIERAADNRSASIIDVGGGESTLVDDLLLRGYKNLTVLDVSQTAIEFTKSRLGPSAGQAHWLLGDITKIDLESHSYDIWHDRAVFHFLTADKQRVAYLRQVVRSVRPGGHIVISTFGPEGPMKCSGLDSMRYNAHSLQREFGGHFRLVESFQEVHQTPSKSMQQFLYCHFRVE